MVSDLIAAFDELEANKNVGAVVVTGNDNVFCGMDHYKNTFICFFRFFKNFF